MESQLLWLVAAGGIGIGVLVGWFLGRSGARREADRVRDLEQQIERAAADHAQYRTHVSQHFVETSRRLHDLTLQYRSVYEHLADGARTLCPEGAVAIARSLSEAALPESATAAIDPATDDEAQLDLELDAPTRWAATDDDHDLGPILDEDAPPPPTDRAS